MLIYLNGTSSSGKSTIALELQKISPFPIFYFSIDTLLYALSKDDLDAIMGRRPYRMPIQWNHIFQGYFGCISSLVRSGNSVIADLPVYNQNLFAYYSDYICPLKDKIVVGLDCNLNTLEMREKERGDRAVGVAARQFGEIHSFLQYDYRINTENSENINLGISLLKTQLNNYNSQRHLSGREK